MQHMVNSMIEIATCCTKVWFFYLGASNHMTSHGEWFSDVKILENTGSIETGDDIVHPIAQVGKVPLAMQDGKRKCLLDVQNVPNITKHLVSASQMVEQGLQARFNPDGCFVEDLKNQCHNYKRQQIWQNVHFGCRYA